MKIKNVLSLFLVAALLGLLSILLYQTNNPSDPVVSENQQLIDIITQQESDIEEREQNIEGLRNAIDAELDQQTQGLSVITSLRNSLQSARYFSGLNERTGSGIVLTLSDNVQGAELAKTENPDQYRPENYIIHDKNLLYIVNDVKAANPDGIAINNQRIVSNTNIRCVGTVILVNDRRLAPPYQITILGNTDEITQAVFDSGEVEYLVTSGFAITYESKDELTLPAYKGSPNPQYATIYVEPPAEPEEPEEEPVVEPEAPVEQPSSPDETEQTPEEDVAPETDPDASEGDTGTDTDEVTDPEAEEPEAPPVDPQDAPPEEPATEDPAQIPDDQTEGTPDPDTVVVPLDEEVTTDE